MVLEIPIVDDLKLSPADVFDPIKYPKDGYYIADDGAINSLVVVNKNDNIISVIPLSYEVLKNNDKDLKDIKGEVLNLLDQASEVLGELQQTVYSESSQPVTGLVSQEFVLELVNSVKKGK